MPVTDSPVLCHHHLAEWVREYADEIEGVKECEECEGHGRCFNEGEGYTCDKCNGTGKVPNGLGFFVGWIARGKVPR